MKVSVVIPAYNAEKYIAEAIESCLNQTFPPHEIIVVDDASTDSTASLAESYGVPVRVIRLAENSGASVARNQGVEASAGDWIAFLDADDWFLPRKLELQRECATGNDRIVFIYSGFRIRDVDGDERDGQFVPRAELWPMLRYRNRFCTSSILLRRSAFDSVGGFDPSLRVAQDWDLWLRIAVRYSVQAFAAVSAPLAVYRRIAGSLSSDPMRYFHLRARFTDHTCLLGTSGISRFLWRRRVTAFSYYDTSQSLREGGSLPFLSFMFMSFLLWPFQSIAMPNRTKTAIVMLMQTCRNRFFKPLVRLIRPR